jgi:hypothetical protein
MTPRRNIEGAQRGIRCTPPSGGWRHDCTRSGDTDGAAENLGPRAVWIGAVGLAVVSLVALVVALRR